MFFSLLYTYYVAKLSKCISYSWLNIDLANTIPPFLGPNHDHNTNLINPNTITLYIYIPAPKFCPTKSDLVSRYIFVFNSPHLSRTWTCLIGICDMIRGGSPSYHFPIEHCVILLYTNVKICVKVFTTNTITSKFTSKVLL